VEVVRCHNEGAWIGCQGAAVHLRGSVPLCQFCEDAASSLTRLPVRPVRPLDPLGDLRRLQRRRRALEEDLDALVDAAHVAGHSYADIGQALDMTRQAARQRHLRR
jgi:hypothetical protein